ncbi:MAG: nucleoside kinase [Muribaculaceae bacterium]|nr:nucleoside kinase [Muribaculaceae bacterium]
MIIKRQTPNELIELHITNLDKTIEVEGGITLLEVANHLQTELGFEPIMACVNNKYEGLHYQVYGPKKVEFLSKNTEAGRRVYLHSLCMMLYYAQTKTFSGASMRIEHYVSNGLFVTITGVEPTEDNALVLSAVMRRLVQSNKPFVYHIASLTKAMEIFEKQGLTSKVMLLKTIDEIEWNYYTLDDVADSFYGCLAPRTGMIDTFSFSAYNGEGFLLKSFDPANPTTVPPTIQEPLMYRAFKDYLKFNKIVGVSNVGEMNHVVLKGRPADLINVAETLHNHWISSIGERIAERYKKGEARVVLVAGPSSSGKTTTTKRLAVQLMANLLKPVIISLDNYFVDREHTPRDEKGDYDFEHINALDMELLNADLNRILAGEEVALPTYNFETGKRTYRGNTIRLDEGSVLLIEGIHGLNDMLTSQIPDNMKFKLYVSALTTLSIDNHNWISPTDNLLLRRIVRDHRYRGISARESIRRWPSVCRGEDRWIFPFKENADAMFNSSLLFELAVIKDYAETLLSEVPSNCAEYAVAYRLRRFLRYFRQIRPDAIPPTSLLREFLGGSSFKY